MRNRGRLHTYEIIFISGCVGNFFYCRAQRTNKCEYQQLIASSDVTTKGQTVVISPPPSAITPSVNGSSSDLCTVGVAGAVQTQILGISSGETVRDENCERLKIPKTLYDMGMKVAAVSVLLSG